MTQTFAEKMKPQICVALLILAAWLVPCLAEDLPIPSDLSEREISNRILNYEIEGFSLSSRMQLSDFREIHPESKWTQSQYSERTYCDIETGECFTKGLTVQVLKDDECILFLFEDNQPKSKLIGFALDAKPAHDFVDEYKRILLLLGNPNDVRDTQPTPENTTTVFRTWAVRIDGEEIRFNLFWSPWNDIVTWGLSREPIDSEQGGADQPATAPKSKSEGGGKPKPETKVGPQ